MRVFMHTHAQAEPPPDAARLRQVLKDTFSRFNAAIERCVRVRACGRRLRGHRL
jgi:hypothetical protein